MNLPKSVQVGEVKWQKEKEKLFSYVLSYEAPKKYLLYFDSPLEVTEFIK